MKYQDIPQLPRANYSTTIPWNTVEEKIQDWCSEKLCPLNIDPDYQRTHVWTPEQQIRYVEYSLMGGEVGRVITFNCPGWMCNWKGPFELVDGKQRIEAVRAFFRNDIPAFGHFCRDIGGRFPWASCSFTWQICTLETREEILQLYLNINAGGTPHTEDELSRVRALLERVQKTATTGVGDFY